MSRTYVGGFVHVRSTRCSTCIFRPGNLMHLEEGRREQMERDAVRDESVIPCHKHIHERQPIEPVCRGYWDAHATEVVTLRLAQAMGIVRFKDPEGA